MPTAKQPSTPTPTPPTNTPTSTLYSIFSLTHPPTHTPHGAMTELSFAKTFLSTLDARPLKLQPDHVSSPLTLSLNAPYTLPKNTLTFTRRPAPSSSSSSDNEKQKAAHAQTLDVTLKSSKNPVMDLRLHGMGTGTTVLELKERVKGELGLGGVEKVRVLFERKPVGDVKTLKELVGEGSTNVELGVMVMGYKEGDVVAAAKGDGDGDAAMKDATEGGTGTKVAQGESGEEVLAGEEFWGDLRGFLVQRVRDEGVAGEVFGRFRGSWEGM